MDTESKCEMEGLSLDRPSLWTDCLEFWPVLWIAGWIGFIIARVKPRLRLGQ